MKYQEKPLAQLILKIEAASKDDGESQNQEEGAAVLPEVLN